MKKIPVPSSVKQEIEELARRAGRSTGFVTRRALVAAKGKSGPIADGPRADLLLSLDEDDDPKTPKKIAELCTERGGDPGDALASAWGATRAQFHAWLARLEEADAASRADDLDAALAEAESPTTSAERLAVLASHEYVQVRARVAANPNTTVATLEKLSTEREKTIRAALAKNPSVPPSVKAALG